MEVLTAQDRLHALTTADWPNMKQSVRSKLHKDLHRVAYPRTYSAPVDSVELAKILGAGRI